MLGDLWALYSETCTPGPVLRDLYSAVRLVADVREDGSPPGAISTLKIALMLLWASG